MPNFLYLHLHKELSRNLANGKDPIEGTSWKLEEKAVRVPYVGVDKENLA